MEIPLFPHNQNPSLGPLAVKYTPRSPFYPPRAWQRSRLRYV